MRSRGDGFGVFHPPHGEDCEVCNPPPDWIGIVWIVLLVGLTLLFFVISTGLLG